MAVGRRPGKGRPGIEFSGFAGYAETAEDAAVAGRSVPILTKVPILRGQLGIACLPSLSGRRHAGPWGA
jgi:hypothetical protein